MKAISKCGHNIAVFDSDPAVMDYVRRILGDRYRVNTFTEARQLLHTLGGSPAPDLLLMDWHIAEDGAEENALGLWQGFTPPGRLFQSFCSLALSG